MRITIEIAGDRQIDREILRVGEHAGDAAPAFSRIADLLMDETVEQFATEGRHGSGGWKPLKQATVREKERLGSKLAYAGAHQNPRPGSSLPRRRPIELTRSARDHVIKILQRWIVTGELES